MQIPLSFFLFGIATLLPFNVFVSPVRFFGDQFANTWLEDDFEGVFGLANNGMTLLAFGYIFFRKDRDFMRMGLRGLVGVFGANALLVGLKIKGEGYGLFVIASICACAWTSSMVYSSALNLATNHGAACISWFVTGQGCSGLISSLLNIMSLFMTSDTDANDSGFVTDTPFAMIAYFSSVSFFYMKLLNIHSKMKPLTKNESEDEELVSETLLDNDESEFTYYQIGNTLKYSLGTVFLSMAVSLTCYPPLISKIKPHSYYTSDSDSKYFVPILFLLYNLSDVVGRTMTKWKQIKNQPLLLLLSISRISLIFAFLHTNIGPQQGYFFPDFWPILFSVSLGLSNGFLSSCALITPSYLLKTDHAHILGTNLNTVALSLGLVSGSAAGLLLSR